MYAVSRFHLLQEDNPIKLKPRRSESSEPQGCKLRFLAMYSRMSTRRNKTAQMGFFFVALFDPYLPQFIDTRLIHEYSTVSLRYCF